MKLYTCLVAASLISGTCILTAHAQLYWDIDTIDQGGAGGATPSGVWDTGTANWNVNSDGTGLPTTWSAGESAVFSAGTDATGSFDVTVSGTQSLSALTVEEGTIRQLSGTIDFGAVNGVIDVASGATWDVSGSGSGFIAGTAGITKNSAGTLFLGGTEQYSSGSGAQLTINDGVADFSGDLALGTAPAAARAGAVTLDGGTLRYSGAGALTLNANRGIAIGPNGGTIEVPKLAAISGLSTSSGGTAATSLTGSGILTKTGAGRLTLNVGGVPFSGTYRILGGLVNVPGDTRLGPIPGAAVPDYLYMDGGGLRIAVTGGVTLDAKRGIMLGAGGGKLIQPGPGTLTYNGIIAGTSGGGLTVDWQDAASTTSEGGASGGIVVLGGTNTYDGPTTINTGTTLRVGSSANVIPDSSDVTVFGTLDLNANAETVGTVTVDNSAATIIASSGTLTGTAYDLRSSGTISAVLAGAGAATKTTAGTVTLSAANTFAGGFFLNQGTVRVNNAAALGAPNSAVTIADGTTLSTSAGTNRTLTYAFTLNGDVTLGQTTGGTAVVNMAGSVDLAGGTRTITTVNASDTISGVISNGGIIKAGAGTLLLNTVNTYSGDTTINEGIINIDADGSLGDGSGTLNLNGATLNSTANRSVSTDPVANPINLTADSAITTTSAATTVNLNVSTSSFTLTGGTTLTFRNDGADGPLDTFKPRFSGSGFDFTSGINIDNGAVGLTELASFNQASTQTFSGVISGTGAYHRGSGTAGSGGVTIFSGDNTYQGGTTINDGTVQADNTSGSATGTGPVIVGDGAPGTFELGYLSGTGTVGDISTGPVTVQEGGYLAPGDVGSGPGTLTAAGDVTMAVNSHLAIELSGSSADELVVGGNLDLSAAEFLDVTGGGTGPWLIATYVGSLTGTFDNVTSGYSVDYSTSGQIYLDVSSGLLGDFNSDGKVDAADYVTWRKNNGTNNALPNDNGLGVPITSAHYDLWRSSFGNPPGAGSGNGLSGASGVPEPTGFALFMFGVGAGAARRGRRAA